MHGSARWARAADATEALRLLRDGEVGRGLPGHPDARAGRAGAGPGAAPLRPPPTVVFVTAHDDRAVDAYDLGAVDYLLKPVRPERLAESLRRVDAARDLAVPPPPERSEDDEVIPVELAGRTTMLPRSEVRWVEAQGDYARLHTADGLAPDPGAAVGAGGAVGGRRLRPHPPLVPGGPASESTSCG